MKLIRRIEFEHPPHKIRFSPDGSQLLIVTGHEIVCCQVRTLGEFRIPSLYTVNDLAFLSEERIVITNESEDLNLVVYQIEKPHLISAVTVEGVQGICVDYQRQRILAGKWSWSEDDNPSVIIYDVHLHKQDEFLLPYLHMPKVMVLSHSNNKLAIAGIFFRVWDVSSEPKLLSEACPQDSDCTGNPCEADLADITLDGRYAAAGLYGAKKTCAVIDTEHGNIIGWYGSEGDYAASSVAISPDGKYVAVAEHLTTVRIYRVADGVISHNYPVQACIGTAFSPNGDILALSDKNSVTLWSFEPV